jgi:hypothetical protein
VAPYTEVNLCSFGTYTGAEVGVVSLVGFSDPTITHHAGVMGVYDDDYADGAVADCMGQGEGDMGTYGPLFFPVGIDMEGGAPFPSDPYNGLDWMAPPEGLAFRLAPGQRWTLDLHYINTQDQAAVVNTGFNAQLVDPGEVDGWMSAVMFDVGRIDLPPGDSEQSFTCPWKDTYEVLSFMPHMHYFGRSFKVELIRANGEVSTVFEVDDWTPEHKDWPPIQSVPRGSLRVERGDAFRTTCAWTNETGEVQPDPAEMCTLQLVVTPSDTPLVCIAGQYVDQGP